MLRNNTKSFFMASILGMGITYAQVAFAYAPVISREHVSELMPSEGVYSVEGGDTLNRLSQRFRVDQKLLIEYNNLKPPYRLSPGQKIVLRDNGQHQKKSSAQPQVAPVKKELLMDTPVLNSTQDPTFKMDKDIRWAWPTEGNLLEGSSTSKGIDISGKFGDPIWAAADGRVVYSGKGLRGYGNLLIIKHNKNFLTVYAHNDSILVKENEVVEKGQLVAKKGKSDSKNVKLHFEIRYKGEPVDPIAYLQGS